MERVNSFARQLGIREALSGDLGHEQYKAVGIVQRVVFGGTIGVTEHLFVKIAVKMKRFDSNVSSTQVSLEQAPEVLQPVRVDLPVDVPFCMIHELMYKAIMQQIIGDSIVGIHFGTVADILQDFVLQGLALHIWNIPASRAIAFSSHGLVAAMSSEAARVRDLSAFHPRLAVLCPSEK